MAPTAPANIRVLVRVRPLNSSELREHGSVGRSNVLTVDAGSNSKIQFNCDNKENSEDGTSPGTGTGSSSGTGAGSATIAINSVNDSNSTTNNNANLQYMFDAVHGEQSSQIEVYDSVKGIVDAVTTGYNGTIVAYGQTGSGKTHTVFGSGVRCDDAGAGIVQRSIGDIFDRVAAAKAESATNQRTTFKGSFFEIFNERIYDLLASETLQKTLAARENTSGVYVEGLSEIEVGNLHDVEDLLTQGLANRHVASTNMNRTSSRSHALFVLSVKTEEIINGLRKVRTSKFTLVDLAGSERQKSTATFGNRLKEASAINKSLSCLGKVINALVDREHGKASHVPFRDSKLTFLLKDTWGGNSKTCLVATVSPSGLARSETISTLTFAQRAKLIKNNAILNEDTCGTVAALKAEVAKLKSKLQQSASFESLSEVMPEDANQAEYITSLRRRYERAESKIAELEKRSSDDNEIVRTLKRKVQEEGMVRKFKERRLEYYQRKNSGPSKEEQMEVLENEVSLMQKRLEAPSTDAIEWRVAYEEVKEVLESKMQGHTDVNELEEKKTQLEETVDRLCTEKFELEGKVIHLTNSSKETRQEIEAIMKEVDNLEQEMVACQDQLKMKSEQCNKYLERVDAAELREEQSKSSTESTQQQIDVLESRVSELQNALSEQSSQLKELKRDLERKNADYLELETLVKENEHDLETNISELKIKLEECTSNLIEKDDIIKISEDRLSNMTAENKTLGEKMQEALLEVDAQKSTVKEMEVKLESLVHEKDAALDAVKNENNLSETTLKEELLSLQQSLTHSSTEKDNLESRLSCVKEQIVLTTSELGEKQKTIQSLEQQISCLSDMRLEAEKTLKVDITDLERRLAETSSKETDLLAKIAAVEVDKDELNLQLSNMTAENKTLGEKMQEALLEVDAQKSTVKEMEVKLESLVHGKDAALDAVKNENNLSETTLKEELLSLQQSLTHSSTEKDNLESRLSCVKEQIVLTTSELGEKQKTIQSLEQQISCLSDMRLEAEKTLKVDITDLERRLAETSSKETDLLAKIAAAEANGERLSRDAEERKVLAEKQYTAESDLLQNELSKAKLETEGFKEHLEFSNQKSKDLEAQLADLKSKLKGKEKNLDITESEKKAALENVAKVHAEVHTEYDEKLQFLEKESLIEKNVLLQQLANITSDLEKNNAELESMKVKLTNSKSIELNLKSQIQAFDVTNEKSSQGFEREIHRFRAERDALAKERDALDVSLKDKQLNLDQVTSELETLKRAMSGARKKMKASFDAQEKWMKSMDDLVKVHNVESQSARTEIENLEIEISQCRAEIQCMTQAEMIAEAEKICLEKSMKDHEESAVEAMSKISELKLAIKKIETEHVLVTNERDEKLVILEKKLRMVEIECNHLKKENNSVTVIKQKRQEELSTLKDRYSSLQEEKNNIEFELETIQEDQNELTKQNRHLLVEKDEMKLLNDVLQKKLDDFLAQQDHQSVGTSSTWASDSKLSFDNATARAEMKQSPESSKSMDDDNIEYIDDQSDDQSDADDSFDESLFLPNIEGHNTDPDIPLDEDKKSESGYLAESKPPLHDGNDLEVTTADGVDIVATSPESNKENKDVHLSVCIKAINIDYGKKRKPFSDRKNNMTPHSSTNKRAKSSNSKPKSASKKSKSSYMIFDNKKLFQNENSF